MFEDIVLVHRLSDRDTAPLNAAHDDTNAWIIWRTCVRQIALGTAASCSVPLSTKKGDEVYTGAAAYGFFLEVVCGLHSPVLGETEIMGQFKELTAFVNDCAKKFSQDPNYQFFQKFVNAALADTKEVRETHLRDLGNRSYGSLLRKHVKGGSAINIVGAGKLAREILPWIVNKAPLTSIFCRRREQGEEVARDFKKFSKKLSIEAWPQKEFAAASAGGSGTWIIAAPLTASEIQKALEKSRGGGAKIEGVVDLRDSSETDPLHIPGVEILKLKDFFNQMAGTRKEVSCKASLAKELIAALCLKRFRAVEIRPFGWEDLCG